MYQTPFYNICGFAWVKIIKIKKVGVEVVPFAAIVQYMTFVIYHNIFFISNFIEMSFGIEFSLFELILKKANSVPMQKD